MKRRALIVSTALLLLFIAGLVLVRQREYGRETYRGKHARDWAWLLLTSPGGTNHDEATAALRALGPQAVPPLRRMLRERDKFYEKSVVEAARTLPVSQRLMIVRQLRPGQALGNRLAAINALGAIGPAATEAVPDLTAALQDANGQIRWDSARALLAIGDTAIPALMAAAVDTNAGVRHAAVYALADAPTNAPHVVPTLFNALLDPDESVRATAGYSVGRLGLNATPMLMEQIASGDPAKQAAAMRALARVQPPLRLITTNLLAIATQSTGELRRQTIETMGALRMASSNAVAIIMAALDDPDPAMRLTAMKAVGEISWKAAAALAHLEEFTRSTNAMERAESTQALAQFGERASNAVPAIALLLNDPELKVRTAATNALGRINAPTNSW